MTGDEESAEQVSAQPSLVGKPAPDFELTMLDGSAFKLSDHLGKEVIVLDFWATWCGPCIAAMPEVMATVKSFDKQPVRLVAVNQKEPIDKVKRFLDAKGWKLDVAMDANGSAKQRYDVEGIPTTVVIGMDGKVATVHVGFSPHLKEELTAEIRSALR
jgi:peroxiredoxin